MKLLVVNHKARFTLVILGHGKFTFFSVSFQWNWTNVVDNRPEFFFCWENMILIFSLGFSLPQKIRVVNHLQSEILIFDDSIFFAICAARSLPASMRTAVKPIKYGQKKYNFSQVFSNSRVISCRKIVVS